MYIDNITSRILFLDEKADYQILWSAFFAISLRYIADIQNEGAVA